MDTLVIFDFDCTLIDFDSDPWVAEQLGATDLFESLRLELPWNDMMDALMAAVHAQGKTISDIEEGLRSAPLQPEKISAIKAAHALGCELRIVSDANSFFIKTILDKHEVTPLFTNIHTNPAFVDESGRLHIGPFHPKSQPPHGCTLCPPNMCKGRVIDGIRAAVPADVKKRIIYVGDGSGDFCPSLKLAVGDSILAREGYPLLELLTQNRLKAQADVHPWKSGKNIEDTLLTLLHGSQMGKVTCGICGTCGLPQKLDQACGIHDVWQYFGTHKVKIARQLGVGTSSSSQSLQLIVREVTLPRRFENNFVRACCPCPWSPCLFSFSTLRQLPNLTIHSCPSSTFHLFPA